jgi:hypothetical protein
MRASSTRRRRHALVAALALPFAHGWTDTGLISADDDWSGVPGVVGHRGDGLAAAAGADPALVVADGSATPVDVNANEDDPLAVGLPAGVTEFELPDPVVALQGSGTAAAPHLLLSLDARGHAGITVRYRLRDVDASRVANAVQPVALQYRLGLHGDFVNVPAGYVADATSGPGEATLVTPVAAQLPAVANDRPLVQVRVITTNASGQDEWVGVDDVEVSARPAGCPPAPPTPGPPAPPTRPPPSARPLALTDLALEPATFAAARRGRAVTRTGRAGAALRFRLTRPATVSFEVRAAAARARPPRGAPHAPAAAGTALAGRFTVRGRRGLNRLRFTGRLRGRALPKGAYRLTAVAVRGAERSKPASVAFRIR